MRFTVHPDGGLIYKNWWIWHWSESTVDGLWSGSWLATTPIETGNYCLERKFIYQQTGKPYPIEYQKGDEFISTGKGSPFSSNIGPYQKVEQQILALENLTNWIDNSGVLP